jgi:hypothetical protein
MMVGSLPPQRQKKQNPAFVKVLETVAGPSGNGMFRETGHAADGTIED